VDNGAPDDRAQLAALLDELVQVATRAVTRIQGLATGPRGIERRMLEQALFRHGWPPGHKDTVKAAGRKSGRARAVGKMLRHAVIQDVMCELPGVRRNTPRAGATIAAVHDELRRRAPGFLGLSKHLLVSEETVRRDLHDLGYRTKKSAK
jgi:hypothetical protein